MRYIIELENDNILRKPLLANLQTCQCQLLQVCRAVVITLVMTWASQYVFLFYFNRNNHKATMQRSHRPEKQLNLQLLQQMQTLRMSETYLHRNCVLLLSN